MYRTLFLSFSAFIFSSATLAIEPEKKVSIYNWSDYIAKDTIEKFEEKTGISVTYDVFDSNEILEAKLLSGQSGYDVVVPTTDFLARQIKAGAYQKLDKSKIPNLNNLDQSLLSSLSSYDPNFEYSVPYQWGTTGIGYNVDQVKEALGEDAPLDSWDLVFNPEYAQKLKGCGITFLDSASEILPLALIYLGKDPSSTKVKDYEAARDLLMKVRENIRYFHSSRYISDLANGEVCVSIGWSGDVFQSSTRATETKNGVNINYYIPKEGTVISADMMAIPFDAYNVDEAHQWINFILTPQIGADITNHVKYGSPNAAAVPYIHSEILENRAIYPAEGMPLHATKPLRLKLDRVLTRIWTSIKKG